MASTHDRLAACHRRLPDERRPAIRTKIFAANWKMFKTTAEAEAFCQDFVNMPRPKGIEVAIFPPFTALSTVSHLMAGKGVTWGGQNFYPKDNGAFTGEVSPLMLKDLGCTWALVGHSERRHVMGETDEFLAKKIAVALAAGLKANICVGETEKEREQGQTNARVRSQLESALAVVPADKFDRMCVSYEPVWAIGTGKNATSAQAQEVCSFIRGELAKRYGADKASQVRILYGGSVKPDNIGEFTSQPDIDGALVGGASLVAESFHQIIVRGSKG
jgi:triosephosphate isomerase (TIM)